MAVKNFMKRVPQISVIFFFLILFLIFEISWLNTNSSTAIAQDTVTATSTPSISPVEQPIPETIFNETESVPVQKFINFLDQPDVKVLGWSLGAFGWVFGIIAGWIQLKSYRGQKQLENAYHTLFDQAQREWQGKYTEEQIAQLTQQFQQLEAQIRKDIPQQARRVFLQDKQRSMVTSIGELYQQYQTINQELTSQGIQDNLAPQLKQVIEDHILPDYLGRQHQQRNLYIAVIIILLLSLFPFISELLSILFYELLRNFFYLAYITPKEAGSYVGGAIISIPITLLISRHHWLKVVTRFKRLSFFTGLIMIIFWVFIVGFALSGNLQTYLPYEEQQVLPAILSLIFLSLGIRILHVWYSLYGLDFS